MQDNNHNNNSNNNNRKVIKYFCIDEQKIYMYTNNKINYIKDKVVPFAVDTHTTENL